MKYKYKKAKTAWEKYTEGPFGTIIYIFLGFLIAYLLNAGLGFALGTDTPVVAVFSESMVPTLQKGDMIIVQGATGAGITAMIAGKSETEKIEKGDIIIFDVPSYKYPLIHRILDIDEEDGKITTKGDNNMYNDPWKTDKQAVHGKAVLRIPYLGLVKVAAFQFLGLA